MFGDWIDVDTHFEIAVVPTEQEIRDAILNSQTLERVHIDDVDEENGEKPPSNKEILEALSVLRKAVRHHADKKDLYQHYSYTVAQGKFWWHSKTQKFNYNKNIDY